MVDVMMTDDNDTDDDDDNDADVMMKAEGGILRVLWW